MSFTGTHCSFSPSPATGASDPGRTLRIYPDGAELRDGNGGTFLHTVCRERQSSVVSAVIKSRTLRGLLLDAQDRNGNTALHLAVAAGAPGVVESLLRKGEARADS